MFLDISGQSLADLRGNGKVSNSYGPIPVALAERTVFDNAKYHKALCNCMPSTSVSRKVRATRTGSGLCGAGVTFFASFFWPSYHCLDPTRAQLQRGLEGPGGDGTHKSVGLGSTIIKSTGPETADIAGPLLFYTQCI